MSPVVLVVVVALVGGATAAGDFVFGYGSLINDASRQRTCPGSTIAYPARLSGYRRAWRYAAENMTAVGVYPADRKSSVHGVVFRVNPGHLPALDHRERHYARVRVKHGDLVTIGLDRDVVGERDRVWLYVLVEGHFPKCDRPIRQGYVDVIMQGCLGTLGVRFAREFVIQTEDWDGCWVNDRDDRTNRRVPIDKATLQLVDMILSDTIPRQFANRLNHIASY
ncbi:Gamma-glutamylcyclotransferase AIG2-like domain-containing protein [Plasmodiophora brassicae]|uniref:Gamma-glutamylcyclotransferase AIG2-like domain-containing protein n=1 Tax=Plasmodiophora brassicae TaxID=37360 RepID=A0A3P3Y0V3_PLABS|nr:unnamed protein product [Plasmodiophora brassicae]